MDKLNESINKENENARLLKEIITKQTREAVIQAVRNEVSNLSYNYSQRIGLLQRTLLNRTKMYGRSLQERIDRVREQRRIHLPSDEKGTLLEILIVNSEKNLQDFEEYFVNQEKNSIEEPELRSQLQELENNQMNKLDIREKISKHNSLIQSLSLIEASLESTKNKMNDAIENSKTTEEQKASKTARLAKLKEQVDNLKEKAAR